MKITSIDPLLLDELFNDLEQEHISVTKETIEVKDAMGIGTTVVLILDNAVNITKLLAFWTNQKNYYIHIKLKDGREMKLNNLSQEKQQQEFESIKGSSQVLSIDIGRK